MQTGLTINELAQKIQANKELKKDFIAPVSRLAMNATQDANGVYVPRLELYANDADYLINNVAHDQLASFVDIPKKYYDRMLAKQPTLLAANVNRWLRQFEPDTKRMVRTLGSTTRALLSNRFNRIENEEIAEVALPVLAEIPDVRIVSSEITDRRMYIQAVVPSIQAEVKVGDIVQAGVVISNSEVGYGSVSVSDLVWRLRCLNGMKSADPFRVYHVGRRVEDSEELWADDTRRIDDRAVLLKVRDMVRAAVDGIRFRNRVAKLADLTTQHVTGDPTAAVQVLAAKVGASEAEQGGILRSLIEGGDLSAWGMLNAVTAQAHALASYDRAVEFEELGGKLAELSGAAWREILEADAKTAPARRGRRKLELA